MNIERKPASRLLIWTAWTLAALVLYVASYYSMLESSSVTVSISPWRTRLIQLTSYRFGGKVAERLYTPMNRIDHRIRPEFWHGRWRRIAGPRHP